MVDFKKMNVQAFGHLAVLAIVLLVIAHLITTFVGPLLVTIGLTKVGLTLTETLLLLIAIKLYSCHKS